MSQQAMELAERFARVAADFADEMAALTPAQWNAFSPDEGRTVAALARHVAFGYRFEMDAFLAIAEGRDRDPVARAALDRGNAEDALAYAACDQAETVALLREEAAAVAAIVRGLPDEALVRSGVFLEDRPPMTVERWIERVLIGHPGMHLPAIRAAARRAAEDGEREAGDAADSASADPIVAARDAFVERLVTASLGLMDSAAVWLGDRLGYYRLLADHGPLTSGVLAERSATAERYAREWLEQQAVSGFLTVDDAAAPPGERRYALPAGHAEPLTDADSLLFMSPMFRALIGSALQLPAVLEAFRTGGGVPYAAYGAEVCEGIAAGNRPFFLHQLGTEWLPAIPDVHARLRAQPPARVADIGCGSGWSSIAIALAYPAVLVDGFDLDQASVAAARANAGAAGVADRARFHVRDAGDPGLAGRYDLAIAIECIHDMADPVAALRAMRALTEGGGTAIVVDEKAAETFTAPGDDTERLFYGFSILHCLPVGMAEQPSAGTGTAMRPATLRRYALEAGFRDLEILPIEHDAWRFYRLIA